MDRAIPSNELEPSQAFRGAAKRALAGPRPRRRIRVFVRQNTSQPRTGTGAYVKSRGRCSSPSTSEKRNRKKGPLADSRKLASSWFFDVQLGLHPALAEGFFAEPAQAARKAHGAWGPHPKQSWPGPGPSATSRRLEFTVSVPQTTAFWDEALLTALRNRIEPTGDRRSAFATKPFSAVRQTARTPHRPSSKPIFRRRVGTNGLGGKLPPRAWDVPPVGRVSQSFDTAGPKSMLPPTPQIQRRGAWSTEYPKPLGASLVTSYAAVGSSDKKRGGGQFHAARRRKFRASTKDEDSWTELQPASLSGAR